MLAGYEQHYIFFYLCHAPAYPLVHVIDAEHYAKNANECAGHISDHA